MTPRNILLNPGPVTLSDRVRNALTREDWCHREPEFAQLTQSINERLVRVHQPLQSDYQSVIMTGSGTCAVEAMLGSFAPRDTTTLVIANGVYGERMSAILSAQQKPIRVVATGWEDPIDLGAVRTALDRDSSISHIAVVHHETTTGRLNELDELGCLCRDRKLAMLLDAVSSFGAENIEGARWNLAALAATSNKCLHGVPGISFVLASMEMWSRLPQKDPVSVYFDLWKYHNSQHGEGFSPFTQSIQSAFALDEALSELNDQGGWACRREQYIRRASRIHDCLKNLGVKTLLPIQDYSSVMWSYFLPDGITYKTLHDSLKQQGFVIYAGQGELSSSIFRLANMGDIRSSDLDRLCAALETVISCR